MPPLKIINETQYDGRQVAAAVRFVFRELDLDGTDAVVKIKHHRGVHAYQGSFYSDARRASGFVFDWRTHDWKEVAPSIPRGYRYLLVCRIGKEGTYPRETHVYDRRDSPGTWVVETWAEALVSIVGHEATHLKQYLRWLGNRKERFNEVETEWATKRMWQRWKDR